MSETRALTNYDAALAAAAQRYASAMPTTGGNFISVKGGIMSYQDEPLPGNQLACVILDSINEHNYYQGRYNPDQPASPVCYAFGRDNEPMAPHVSMAKHLDYFQPQADNCAVCQWNVFGSSDEGRGKACKNIMRLSLIPCGYYEPTRRGSKDLDLILYTDEDYFTKAEIIGIKIPVTSVKHYAKFVQQAAAAHNRPPFGVFARVWLEPDTKSQFKVLFEMLEPAPPALIPLLFDRNDEAMKTIITPYTPPDPNAPSAQQGRGQLQGLRRR